MVESRSREVATIAAVATIIVFVIAAPVLRAPSERIFGMEIVGRHHDPFTVIAQLARPIRIGIYSQPVTDSVGALFARVIGPVAAYNWLVLLTFPLAAVAAGLLARHLGLRSAGVTVAALAYAFSPFHIAQAAYHPHIAQTQWMPLYLLALWRCLDAATPAAIALLGLSAAAVVLSNFYAGLIAAVLTPVAIAAYWAVRPRGDERTIRPLALTVGSLMVIACGGIAYAWVEAHAVVAGRAAFAFPREELFRYSAKWWSYLVPPVANPVLGGVARRIWIETGVDEGLLEQQVSLGWGIVALAAVAVFRWLASQPASLSRVPLLLVVAGAALMCSLSPERRIGGFTFVRPSAILYDMAPMFRAYARFGVVVQLMAAILAGIGVDCLWHARRWRAQIVCVTLVVLSVGEYMVWPPAAWRDVLPTSAHRWIARQPDRQRVLDCALLTPESASVQWLTGGQVSLLNGAVDDCLEPDLPQKLAAIGYTHLLVRRDTWEGRWFANRLGPDGLRRQAHFDDGDVFAVTAARPSVYTAGMTAFSGREYNEDWTWRWMGPEGSWTIVNSSGRPITAIVSIEMTAFQTARQVELLLDRRNVQTLRVDERRRIYQVGPLALAPGEHELVFHPIGPATIAAEVTNTGDRRPLTLAFGRWHWRIEQRP